MKLRFPVGLFLVIGLPWVVSSAVAAPESYKIDPVHSSITFKVRHLFSFVTGKFTKFDGTFMVDPDAVEQATVTATVQTGSVDTANASRDGDLKGADFFDATKFPELTFKSKSVKQTGKDTADILGDFTMHGVTKDLTLHAQFLGKGKGMKGQISGWHLTTEPIKRSDYGLNWNKAIEGTQVVETTWRSRSISKRTRCSSVGRGMWIRIGGREYFSEPRRPAPTPAGTARRI